MSISGRQLRRLRHRHDSVQCERPAHARGAWVGNALGSACDVQGVRHQPL